MLDLKRKRKNTPDIQGEIFQRIRKKDVSKNL